MMDTKTQAVINELIGQRNQASNAVAECAGIIAELREQLGKRDAEIAELKEKSEKEG